MADFIEKNEWAEKLRMIEPGDSVIGGVNAPINLPFAGLANRTLWLKNEIAAAVQTIGGLGNNKADKTTQIIAGNGITGGGDLSANHTLALGTPGKITATTTNSVSETSHTHEIDNASTAVPGVVKLNNTLSSTSNAEALTANQGRLLNNAKADKATTLAGYGIADGVTQAALSAAINNLVGGAPGALDTLRELAAALGNDANFANNIAAKIDQAAPAGTVAYVAGSAAPAGWLKANGAAVSRTTYAPLFAAIGTRYGAGDGSSTFNLPDLRGEFIRGWDDGRGVDVGRALGSAQGDAIRNITGTMKAGTVNYGQSQFIDELLVTGAFGRIDGNKGWTGDSNANNGQAWGADFDAGRVVPTAPENRPRNIALLAIVKI